MTTSRFNYHLYDADTQLYVSFDTFNYLAILTLCIEQVNLWIYLSLLHLKVLSMK